MNNATVSDTEVTFAASLDEEFRRLQHGFATAELSDERVQAIGASRMNERRAPLDAMLDRK